ncbi:MAG: hypothetical protein QM597_06945 [Aeromicrobium sp.]|uniref:hypothetical protein n=1 Tax=Aeromicrobium sp. TaxID=1871063 RepID=UPI0039E429E4
MFSVAWGLYDGSGGEIHVIEGDRFVFGSGIGTVRVDLPGLSREALVIRATPGGPLLFRGQRENGAFVVLVGNQGGLKWVPEGRAIPITQDANRIELRLAEETIFAAEVTLD